MTAPLLLVAPVAAAAATIPTAAIYAATYGLAHWTRDQRTPHPRTPLTGTLLTAAGWACATGTIAFLARAQHPTALQALLALAAVVGTVVTVIVAATGRADRHRLAPQAVPAYPQVTDGPIDAGDAIVRPIPSITDVRSQPLPPPDRHLTAERDEPD